MEGRWTKTGTLASVLGLLVGILGLLLVPSVWHLVFGIAAQTTIDKPSREPTIKSTHQEPTIENARTSFAAFTKLRKPANDGDDVQTKRSFISQWKNQVVRWQIRITKISLDTNGDIDIVWAVDASLPEHNRVVTSVDDIVLSKFRIPPQSIPLFNALRVGDRLEIEGRIEDPLCFTGLTSSFLSLARMDRL
jgi:hypothetical protein